MKDYKLFSLFFLFLHKAVATFENRGSISFFSIFIFLLVHTLAFGQTCLLHNQAQFTHELEYINCKAHRMYPVTWKRDKVRMIVVPAGVSQQAQYLLAATYQMLEKSDIDMVIVMCQGDESLMRGIALPLNCDDVVCLKNVTINKSLLEKLSQHHLFYYYQVPFYKHEGLQQQCKFLEFYLPHIQIVPMLVGSLNQADAFEVAKTVAEYCLPQTVVIMSADIGRYENVTNDCLIDISKNCKIYDQDAWLIQAIQAVGKERNIVRGEMFTSSIFMILSEMLLLTSFEHVESYFVGYATSYDDHEDAMELIESYGAFIFQDCLCRYRNHIGFYEQLQLLAIARTALDNFFDLKSFRKPLMVSYEILQPHGLYASLYGMSDHGLILRGCIGKAQTTVPLYKMVTYMTEQAAYKDTRFYPLRHRELAHTIISLSLVKDLKQVQDFQLIQESDGIMLQYDDQQAVSLPFKIPTKAPAQPWTYESALTKLSEQIKLRSSLWKKPRAKIFTFYPQIFQEE